MGSSHISRPHVLIACRQGDWDAVLRLPRFFSQAGARVDVFTPVGASLTRSMYRAECFTVPSNAEMAAGLVEHLGKHRYDLIIIGDELTMTAVLAEKPDLVEQVGPSFPITDPHRIGICTGKAGFTQAALQHGIPVPASRICKSRIEVEAAAADIGYPVMLKADRGFAGNGVIRVNNATELSAAFEQLRHRLPLVVQEFTEGVVGSTQLILRHGKPVLWLPLYKHICFPTPMSPSCVRRLMDARGLAAMEPIARAVGEITRFNGPCNFDWIERGPGDFKIIEFNPRPTTGLHLCRFAGIDLIRSFRALLGEDSPLQQPNPAKPGRDLVYTFPQFARKVLNENAWPQARHLLPGLSQNDVPWGEPLVLLKVLKGLAATWYKQRKQTAKEPPKVLAAPSQRKAAA